MSAIGKGDWVECVRITKGDYQIRLRDIYCVEAVVPQPGSCRGCEAHGVVCERVGIVLVGVRVGERLRAWCSRAFAPIYRPKSSLIQQLSQPINADV